MQREHEGPADDRFTAWLEACDVAIARGDDTAAVDDTFEALEESEGPQAESPQVREQVEGCLRRLDRLRRAGPSSKSQVACEASATEWVTDQADRIGRFLIERELGRGGCAVVFLAEDPKLGRKIALKVPRPEALVSRELRDRFLREAQAAAGLDHPNLVPIFEAGNAGPVCYIASTWIDGETLAAHLRERSSFVPQRTAAEWVLALAGGVQHAHDRGILHRDIKPGNVLLDRRENGGSNDDGDDARRIPRLADFGLAKLLDAGGDYTRTGSILGTPAYMASEQAEGRLADIDARTDVYALGAVLYELLTGRPPLRGESDADTLRRIVSDEPAPPSRERQGIARDLEAICLKCLEKSPARRYRSASELAEDLRRFLSGEPTVARPLGAAARTFKWLRRRPAVAAAITIGCLAVVTVIGGQTWNNARLGVALHDAQTQRERAESETTTSRRLFYSANVRLAYETFEANNVSQAIDLLELQRPAPGEEDLREFAWYLLRERCEPRTVPLVGHQGAVFCIVYSPDGQMLATAGEDCTVRLWDAATGTSLRVLRGHDGEVTSVAFSPDGKLLVSGSEDGTVRSWNPQTGERSRTLGGHADHVLALAFSPGGNYLATGSRDLTVRVWEMASGATEAQLDDGLDVVRSVEFSPDGTKLYAVDEDGQLHAWETENWRRAHRERLDNEKLFALAVSGDGALVASAGRRMQIDTWRVGDPEFGHTPFSEGGHREWIQSLDFCATKGTLASGGKDGVIQLWERGSSTPQQSLLGHTDRVWSVAFAPNGRCLASAGGNGEAMIWTPHEGSVQRYPTIDSYINCGVFAPDRSELYVGTEDGRILIWDPRTRHLVTTIPAHEAVLGALTVSPDGERIASRAKGESVKVWSRATIEQLAVIPTWDETPPIAWAPNGHLLATTDDERTIVVHDIDTGVVQQRISTESDLRHLAFTPDGRQLVSSSDALVVWELRGASKVFTLPEEHSNVVVSSDGTLIAAITGANVTLVDAGADNRVTKLTTVGSDAKCLALSPDGRTLAVALWPSPGAISLWDTRTAQELIRLDCNAKAVSALSFSHDGLRLVLTGVDDDSGGGIWEWSIEPKRSSASVPLAAQR